MDKAQALQTFWSSFDLPAYDVNSVPSTAQMPYITYEASTDSFDNQVSLNASLWYRSSSWEEITKKSEEIARSIVKMNPPTIEIDGGRMYITKETPFSQRMGDEDRSIRRIVMMIDVEFMTET